jgi:hypothetical protein
MFSKLKVENVLNPPQNPVAAKRKRGPSVLVLIPYFINSPSSMLAARLVIKVASGKLEI